MNYKLKFEHFQPDIQVGLFQASHRGTWPSTPNYRSDAEHHHHCNDCTFLAIVDIDTALNQAHVHFMLYKITSVLSHDLVKLVYIYIGGRLKRFEL